MKLPPFRTRAPGKLLLVVGVSLVAPTVPADSSYALRLENIVTLHVNVLDVQAEGTFPAGSGELDVSGSEAGQLELRLPWNAAGAKVTLVLNASGQPGDETTPHRIKLHSALATPGGRFVSNRDLTIPDAGTQLVDIYEDNNRRMVLVLKAQSGTRPIGEIIIPAAPGQAVRLSIEIERVDGDRFVPLETNQLSTFVGFSVEYSFRRGAGDGAEWVVVRMRPTRIVGDVAEIAVEVTASLPGDPDRLLLSRRETIMSSRGVMSSLIISSGEPPAGYRFRITPEF